MDLVGQEFKEFRSNLLLSTPPSNLRELVSTITPPEGVRRSDHDSPRDLEYIPFDEGAELFDGEGSDLDNEVCEKYGSQIATASIHLHFKTVT